MTVQNLEEKAELNETIERLKAQFAAVSNNLEVQTADNSELSRYAPLHVSVLFMYHFVTTTVPNRCSLMTIFT